MLYQDKLIRKLAKKYNKDYRVIQAIVYSPLKFLNRIVQNSSDIRPVRIRYFGVFAQKAGFNKKVIFNKMVEELLNNIKDVVIVMGAVLQFPVNSTKSAIDIIKRAEESCDYDKIKMIWDAWKEYSK